MVMQARVVRGHLARVASREIISSNHDEYGKLLSAVQQEFVGGAGETLYKYISMLHKRLAPRFENIHGFENWDWGIPQPAGENAWNIRIWNKSGAQFPSVLDGNLLMKFVFTDGVQCSLVMGNTQTIFQRKWGPKVTASDAGMKCGEAWETLLTGSVDYGD
jgi:hypothetical protein